MYNFVQEILIGADKTKSWRLNSDQGMFSPPSPILTPQKDYAIYCCFFKLLNLMYGRSKNTNFKEPFKLVTFSGRS